MTLMFGGHGLFSLESVELVVFLRVLLSDVLGVDLFFLVVPTESGNGVDVRFCTSLPSWVLRLHALEESRWKHLERIILKIQKFKSHFFFVD